jgi:hypothetical protein
VEDACKIPDIRNVIIDGTDEEFNACDEEVTSGFPSRRVKLHIDKKIYGSLL